MTPRDSFEKAEKADARRMKACSYCGRDNDDEAIHCRECGTDFSAPATSTANAHPDEPITTTRFIDLDRLEGAFDFQDGLSRPEWGRISKTIQPLEDAEDRREAWREAVLQWLLRLREELGGDYRVISSRRCALLSLLDRPTAQRLLDFSDTATSAIRSALGEIAWESFDGLQVIIVFAEEDDYYQYISGFHSEGEHPKSIGVHIHRGYPHVALLYETELRAGQTILHELAHHCLTHLPVPLWLNEGVAQHLQK